MGFFSNLKNKVTGGAAKVHVNVAPGQRGQNANVQVQAQASGKGKVSDVYLIIRASEKSQVHDVENKEGKKVTVNGQHVTYEKKISIAPAFELVEGESYSWEAAIEIPSNLLPSLGGKLFDHVWEIQAGLDMPGNDPDSGWQTFTVT